jgi:hypothetical protein
MRERVGDRLPRFTYEERELVRGSADFFGLGHFTSHLCAQPAWYKELGGGLAGGGAENRKGLARVAAGLAAAVMAPAGAGEIEEGFEPVSPAREKVQEWMWERGAFCFWCLVLLPSAGRTGGDICCVCFLLDNSQNHHGPTLTTTQHTPKTQPTNQPKTDREPDPYIESTGYWQDMSVDRTGDAAWKTTATGAGVHPEGIRRAIGYVMAEYAPRGGVMVTENGVAVDEGGRDEAVKDIERAVFLKRYLTEVHRAIVKDGADVRGYFVRSLLDDFGWRDGYGAKYGLCHVDFKTLERVPKMSANWFAEVAKRNRLEI